MKIEDGIQATSGPAAKPLLLPAQATHWLASLEQAWLSAWPASASSRDGHHGTAGTGTAARDKQAFPRGGDGRTGTAFAQWQNRVPATRNADSASEHCSAQWHAAQFAGSLAGSALAIGLFNRSSPAPAGEALDTPPASPADASADLTVPASGRAASETGRTTTSASSSDLDELPDEGLANLGAGSPDHEQEPLGTSLMRVTTQSTHALLTIRDVQLGVAESSRVAMAVVAALNQQGYRSVTTYVNGVARRHSAPHPAQVGQAPTTRTTEQPQP